jgi:glc operon protein GlcG
MKTLARIAAVISILATGSTTWAQPPGGQRPPPPPPSLISYDQALTAVQAAEAVADENGWPLTILVVDQNNNPVMMHRMQDATPRTFQIAQMKALTVIESGMTSREYGEKVQAGELEQIEGTVTFGGGVPIYLDGTLIGAVTASGARPDEDEAASRAGAEAIGGSITAD